MFVMKVVVIFIKISNRHTKTMSEICSKLTTKKAADFQPL